MQYILETLYIDGVSWYGHTFFEEINVRYCTFDSLVAFELNTIRIKYDKLLLLLLLLLQILTYAFICGIFLF